MGLIGLAAKTAWGVGKGAAGTVLSTSVVQKAALGGVVGGIYGGTRETYTTNARINNIIKGAAGGAFLGGAGMAGLKYGPGVALGATKIGYGLNKHFGLLGMAGRAGIGTAASIGRTALGYSKFAFRHPYMGAAPIVGAAAIGGGLYAWNQGATTRSPTLSGAKINKNYDEQMAASNNMMSGVMPMGMMGPAPTMVGPMYQAMQQSTQGLVQGLHRGRH